MTQARAIPSSPNVAWVLVTRGAFDTRIPSFYKDRRIYKRGTSLSKGSIWRNGGGLSEIWESFSRFGRPLQNLGRHWKETCDIDRIGKILKIFSSHIDREGPLHDLPQSHVNDEHMFGSHIDRVICLCRCAIDICHKMPYPAFWNVLM
jgi:hypothetical protein